MSSVIVPAHNEADVIGSFLDVLLSSAKPDEFEVIVVCNGCNDATAETARQRAGIAVLEIATASKVAALNAGDQAATRPSRIYVDADVRIDTDSLRKVSAALSEGAVAAAPLPHVDVTGCSPLVRAYFAIWSRLGYTTRHVLGSGIYGLSASGRSRFGEFPELIADDGFVYAQFTDAERENPPGATFVIHAPRTLGALIRRRVRIVAGNVELSRKTDLRPSAPNPRWWQVAIGQPTLLPAAMVYFLVNSFSSSAARRRARTGTSGSWARDDTSRQARR